jgi:hypothetical protein
MRHGEGHSHSGTDEQKQVRLQINYCYATHAHRVCHSHSGTDEQKQVGVKKLCYYYAARRNSFSFRSR